jgi:hypothetical protein
MKDVEQLKRDAASVISGEKSVVSLQDRGKERMSFVCPHEVGIRDVDGDDYQVAVNDLSPSEAYVLGNLCGKVRAIESFDDD